MGMSAKEQRHQVFGALPHHVLPPPKCAEIQETAFYLSVFQQVHEETTNTRNTGNVNTLLFSLMFHQSSDGFYILRRSCILYNFLAILHEYMTTPM